MKHPLLKNINILAEFNNLYVTKNKKDEFALGAIVNGKFVCVLITPSIVNQLLYLKDDIDNA